MNNYQIKKNILVVEDSSSLRKFISITLKLHGYSFVACNDGMEALEKLSQETIDMIITDVSMPNMDGNKLVKAVRGYSEYNKIPIIVLSSMDNPEDIDIGFTAGVNSYMIKPFNSEKLILEISKYL